MSIIQMLLKQAWCHVQFSGETVPLTHHLLGEDLFLMSNQKLPSPLPHPCEEAVVCNEVTAPPSLLQAGQAKWPQPLPLSLALENFHHFNLLPLDSNSLRSFVCCGTPNCTQHSVRPHQLTVWWDNHLPPPILNAVLSSLETYTELHTTTATHLMTAIAAATVNPDRIVRKSNIKKKIICMSVCLFHEFQNRIGD